MAKDKDEKPTKKKKLSKPNDTGTKQSSIKDTLLFSSFGLDGRLLKAVSNQFEKPTLVQAATIPLALNGRDIVARAKTGSGKTLAYVIPIVHQILIKSVCQDGSLSSY
jgi:ATP-dependent RNA helicase DDX56/DBP9